MKKRILVTGAGSGFWRDCVPGLADRGHEVILRVTKLRTTEGELVIIPNGSLRQVTNLSKEWSRAVLDVPIAAGGDLEQATEVLRAVAAGLANDAAWAPCCWASPRWPACRAMRSASSESGSPP